MGRGRADHCLRTLQARIRGLVLTLWHRGPLILLPVPSATWYSPIFKTLLHQLDLSNTSEQ